MTASVRTATTAPTTASATDRTTGGESPAPGAVFADLVGQDTAVDVLRRAVTAASRIREGLPVEPGEMTHAWLFSGPPGSGRSVAARAFAAALQCVHGGCGRCAACRTTLAGTHADVRLVVPEGLSIPVRDMRELVLCAASAPTQGRWQVVLIEDADRLGESASNALLKAVEEPPDRTVFLLCVPSTHPDDVSVTVRSRCRVVALRAPSAEAVTAVLVDRDGVEPATARWAAGVAQGHVGRARRLAGDPDARARRRAVLDIPRGLTGIGAAFTAAERLIGSADAEAAAATTDRAARETEDLRQALGGGGTGKGAAAAARGTTAQLKELERRQRSRATRAQRDALDRALVDLASFYRDVLAVGLRAGVPLVNADSAEQVEAAASRWSPEQALRRLEAVLACRDAVEENAKPRIAVEAMMLRLLG